MGSHRKEHMEGFGVGVAKRITEDRCEDHRERQRTQRTETDADRRKGEKEAGRASMPTEDCRG